MALATRAPIAGILSLCLLLLSSVGGAGALASPASQQAAEPQSAALVSGTVSYQPDARVRRIGKHNMVGNDIYNADGTNQTLSDTLGDRRVRFVITIQNDGDVADSFTIDSSNGVFLVVLPPVNFYHGWGPAEDITADVMAGTYTTPTIQPGGVYRIRAVVRPLQINLNHLTAGVSLLGYYSWLVTAKSVANPTKADAVRFEVTVQFT